MKRERLSGKDLCIVRLVAGRLEGSIAPCKEASEGNRREVKNETKREYSNCFVMRSR